MKKQPEITAQTKQNLKDAFWKLYCVKRIDKITVKEIAATAGYNRGTFYEYFTDAYDVLDQIESSLLPNPEEFPAIGITNNLPAEPMGNFIRMYVDNSKYYIVLLGDDGDPAFINKMKNSIMPRLKQTLIDQGAADGFELDYTIEYTLSAMIGVLSYWFRQQDTPPTEKLLNLISEIMRDGVMKIISNRRLQV